MTQMRQSVKKIFRPCVTCKRIQGKHYKAPRSPPLPEERVQKSRPFINKGLDYTGPLLVKAGKDEKKAYIVVFTSAIHF